LYQYLIIKLVLKLHALANNLNWWFSTWTTCVCNRILFSLIYFWILDFEWYFIFALYTHACIENIFIIFFLILLYFLLITFVSICLRHEQTNCWPKKRNTRTSAKNWTKHSTNCKAIKHFSLSTSSYLSNQKFSTNGNSYNHQNFILIILIS